MFAEGEIKKHAVFRRHAAVGVGVEKETRRRLARDGAFVGEILDKLGVGVVAQEIAAAAFVDVRFVGKCDDGIGKYGEIGAGTDAVDGVGAGGIAGIEMGGGSGGKVAAGAEAHDADFGGVYPEFGGAGADGADGALGVHQHGRVTVFGAEAVAENEGGDALGVEPLGDLLALVIIGERAVSATGADDDGLSIGVLSNPGRKGGNVFFLRALSAGRPAGPKGEGGRVRRLPLSEQRRGGEEEEERLWHWGNDIARQRCGARPNTMLVYGSGEFNR